MDRKKLFMRLAVVIFFIFFLNFIGDRFYWYSSIWYFDIIMHTLGGFWVGLLLFWVFGFKNINWKFILKIILGVLIIGIFWEVFEIIVNKTIAQNPFNFLDAVSDIFCDLAGGLFASTYIFKKIIKKEKIKL
ncbi:MAG: hypothetical protein ABH951_00895 [Patescibacteria group bacterium]